MSPRTLPAARAALVLSCWLALACVAHAQPAVTNISLRGLQIGQATTLVIDGSDLAPEPQIVMPIPIAAQTVKSAAANRVEIEVTAAESVLPGIYPLRIVSRQGISDPVLVGVDRLPQQPFAARVAALPVALHGVLRGSEILKTTLAGTAGMRLVVDVESRRLGGQLKPILRLHDARGRQIAWSQARAELAGDARFEAVLPADGEYTVALHDVIYRAAAPGFFRLKIGDLQFADMVFPLGVQRGTAASLAPVGGNLPSTEPVAFTAAADDFRARQPAPLPPAANLTGSRPVLIVSDHAEIVETSTDGQKLQQIPPAPVAINGRLAAADEEDRFLLAVQPGSKLRLDVVARRAGSPLDGVLVVRDEKGTQLARNDDRPGMSDPGLDVTVPPKVENVVISLTDLLGQGGEAFVYRIEVQDLGRADFSLVLDDQRVNIPAGGAQVISVRAERRGYNGPIRLEVEGLPEGVQVAGGEIAAGARIGLLSLSAAGEAVTRGLVRVVGRGGDAPAPLVRMARTAASDAVRHQPWLADDLAMAVSAPVPIGVDWASDAGSPLLLGERVSLPLKLTRQPGTEGQVRVRLVTTQVMPKKKIKENNKDKVVDDVDRALRLEGDPQFGTDADQTAVSLLVPADLPRRAWGLALRAELLSSDGKRVLASTTTPVRTLAAAPPFTLELAGAKDVEARAGLGEAGRLSGVIHRVAGYTRPVTVTLEGLPKGYTAPEVEVPGDQDRFELPVRFAYGAKAGELKNVRLVGRAKSEISESNATLLSNRVALGRITVVPGEKPPGEKPYEVFEDDEKFVTYLASGGGQISLESADKYSGQASIKVTPDQRFQETVPNLQVKIRENPGPGEYRYLRFAWKKKGGSTVCLQINHDGTWGPGGSGKEGAKFRYHAGGESECFGASLVVAAKLPEEFVVVTRDLFADFGEFTFSGIAFSPIDGDYALFDHLYLARSASDFDLLAAE